jgi:hypothetical protein
MEENHFDPRAVCRDHSFLRYVPQDIRDQFIETLDKETNIERMATLKAWLIAAVKNEKNSEDFRIVVLKMIVPLGKGEEWLRVMLVEALKNRRFEWYFRSLIMTALVAYWQHEQWMSDIFRSLLDDRQENCFVRSGAESRLSRFWANEEWLPERLREIVLNPNEHGEVQFNIIRSMGEYWKDSPWLRTTLEEVMFSQKHDIETKGQAAFRLLKVFGQSEWLQDHFERILSDREQGDTRLEILRIVGEGWNRPAWLDNHVLDMIFDRKNKFHFRSEVLDHFAKVWSGSKVTRVKLGAFFEDKRQNSELRHQVRQILEIPYRDESMDNLG